MKWSTGAMLAVLLAAAGCRQDSVPDRRRTSEPDKVPTDLEVGKQIYRARCSACHGVHGAGTNRGPPLVHPVYRPRHHADEAFQRAVAFGVQAHHWDFGPMEPIPALGREEVARVTTYVRWLQQRAGLF